MASVVWMSVFILLIAELIITLLLVLPLPRFFRRFLAKKIFSYGLAERIRFFARFILLGLVFAVADAISSLRHLIVKEAFDTGASTGERPASYITTSLDKQRKFRAERNVSLFLSFFLIIIFYSCTLSNLTLSDFSMFSKPVNILSNWTTLHTE